MIKFKLKIKKGDIVKVIAGDSKGQQGKVLKVMVSESKAIVEGINMVSKSTKQKKKNTKGGIVKQEAPEMILYGKSNTLKKAALKGAGILKETIEGIKSPGNKESTIKKKGFDNPMVDSGKFKKAASGKVNGVGTFGKGKLG